MQIKHRTHQTQGSNAQRSSVYKPLVKQITELLYSIETLRDLTVGYSRQH